jgi:hypothetical protein
MNNTLFEPPKITSIAARILRDPDASRSEKAVAAALLLQGKAKAGKGKCLTEEPKNDKDGNQKFQRP